MQLRMVRRDPSSVYDGTTGTSSDLDNLGPQTNGIFWFLVVLSLTFLMLRLYCKFKLGQGLWWDDWILVASWVSSVPLYKSLPRVLDT